MFIPITSLWSTIHPIACLFCCRLFTLWFLDPDSSIASVSPTSTTLSSDAADVVSPVAMPDEYAVTSGGESYSSTVASALSDISHTTPTPAEDMKDDESQPQLNSTRMNTRLVTHSQLYCYFSTAVCIGELARLFFYIASPAHVKSKSCVDGFQLIGLLFYYQIHGWCLLIDNFCCSAPPTDNDLGGNTTDADLKNENSTESQGNYCHYLIAIVTIVIIPGVILAYLMITQLLKNNEILFRFEFIINFQKPSIQYTYHFGS